MIIKFETKYGDDFVEGTAEEEIFASVLCDRLDDGVWFDEADTAEAEKALKENRAAQFMKGRRDYEYEGFTIVHTRSA